MEEIEMLHFLQYLLPLLQEKNSPELLLVYVKFVKLVLQKCSIKVNRLNLDFFFLSKLHN